MTALSPRSLVLSLIALLLVSCGAPRIAESQALRAQVGAYELEVLVDGRPARTFSEGGESYVLGDQGSRYVLRVHNRSGRRIEAVVSVDGLDVIDGKSADFAKRGYLVAAYGYVDIEGFRLSQREAAAFRFAPIGESYAAKTGKARNVGVIGVAVFPERVRRAPRAYAPRYPEYEPSYRSRAEEADDFAALGSNAEAKGRAESEPAAAPTSAAPSRPRSAAATESSRSGSGAAADSYAGAPAPQKRMSRGGLGTEFGEPVWSEIRQVEFVRAHASAPSALLGARYNDRQGLLALGIDVDGYEEASDLALRRSARPFPVSQRGFARPPADWRHD